MSGLAESAPTPTHAPVAVSSSAGAAVASPYKGLIPYAEEDAPFFFGRDSEREIISANLLAARLTLLYGASGVGKSSVLRAGVIHHLRRRARQNLVERGTPEFGVVAFSAWRDYPLAALAARINEQLAPLKVGDEDLTRFNPTTQFAEFLAAWSRGIDGDILIILDQFEEYFLYHPQEDGPGTFAYEFPRALNRQDLRISFLLSLRDDAITRLDRFKGSIPSLFDNYLRIEHLDRAAARAAIVEPVAEYNRRRTSDMQEVNIEPELVEAVLDQVRTGQVLLGEAGRGTQIIKGAAAEQIETPYLQLVLTRLWDEELRAGSHLLRRATLDRLGGAERIVRTHLDATMSALPMHEQDVAASVFHYLVTPSGTKIAHTVRDLSEYASRPAEVLEPVLEKLARTRILRSVAPPPHASAHGESDAADAPRYEIFHDVMAPAILDWRTRFKRTRAEDKARQRRRIILGFIIIGVLASVGLSVWQRFAAKKAELATIEAQRQAEEERRKADVAQTSEYKYAKATTLLKTLSEGDADERKAALENVTQLAQEGQLPPEFAPAFTEVIARKEPAQAERVNDIIKKSARAVQTATTPEPPAAPRIFLQITGDPQQPEQAKVMKRQLEAKGYEVPSIERVKRGPKTKELRYFHQADKANAAQVIAQLGEYGWQGVQLRYVAGYEDSSAVRPGQFEFWFEDWQQPIPDSATAKPTESPKTDNSNAGATPTPTPIRPATPPIKQANLIKALSIGGLSANELVQQIEKQGVDFQLTPEGEQQLRLAGAYLGDANLTRVINAVRHSYRKSYSAAQAR